jgi:hypothetical protein
MPLLHLWEGDSLQVINCPSFNDVILDLMGEYHEETGYYVCASFADSLQIQDCLHFSGAALRRLVAAALDKAGDEYHRVEISGRAPEITAEDVEWLSQNVNRFLYNPSRS